MATIQEIYHSMDELAPFSLQESWDNSGLLVGDACAQVTRALITLDITHAAVLEAARLGAQLIISHHPVIFHPLKQLPSDSVVYHLAVAGVGAICAHTNLDIAEGGVNDCLAGVLGLKRIEGFVPAGEGSLGRIGMLPHPMPPEAFARHVQQALGDAPVRMCTGGHSVSRVAVCGGAGGNLIYDAIAMGVDALVTGEAKHHELLDAVHAGLTLVDGTHYATEQVVLQPLAGMLSARHPEVSFMVFGGGDVLQLI